MLRTYLDALALQRASKTGTRDAIEGEIEHQQMVLQQDFGKRAEMTLGISIANAEVGLGLHSERVGEEIVGAKQHVFFEAFDVDLEEVRLGNQAFGKEGVQAAGSHRTGLLVRRCFETTGPLQVHRAGGGICWIEMEHPFLVGITGRDEMVMPVRHAAGALSQLIYGFRDGIEAMDDQVVAEPVPGWIFAALNADVDEHEGLTQKACFHHPVGELGISVGKQIQALLLPALRGPARRPRSSNAAGERYFHSDDQKGEGAEPLFGGERGTGRSLRLVHGTFLPRIGDLELPYPSNLTGAEGVVRRAPPTCWA